MTLIVLVLALTSCSGFDYPIPEAGKASIDDAMGVEISAPDGIVVGGIVDQVLKGSDGGFVDGVREQLSGYDSQREISVALVRFRIDATPEQRQAVLVRAEELGADAILVGPLDLWPHCAERPDCLHVVESFRPDEAASVLSS